MQKELALGYNKSDNVVRNLHKINAEVADDRTEECFTQVTYTAKFKDVAVTIVHSASRLGIDDVSVSFDTSSFASKAAAIRFYRDLKATLN